MSLRHSRTSDRDLLMNDAHSHSSAPPATTPSAQLQTTSIATPVPSVQHGLSHLHGHTTIIHGSGHSHSSQGLSQSVHLNGSLPSTSAGNTTNGQHPPLLVSPIVGPVSAGPGGPQAAGASTSGLTNGVAAAVAVHSTIQKLSKANEETWFLIG